MLKKPTINTNNEAGAYTCAAEESNGSGIDKINKIYKKANRSK